LSEPGAPLRDFLTRHDAPCPFCGHNLKGLKGDRCPACGVLVTLPAVLTRMSRARPPMAKYVLEVLIALLAGWLLLETMFGPLRHGPPSYIREFAGVWVLLVVARVVVVKRAPAVQPLADPPTLADYLAEADVACPMCGYNLRGLAGESCPECGVAVSVQSLNAASVVQREVNAAHIAKVLLGTVAACMGVVLVGAMVFGVVQWVRQRALPGWLVVAVIAVPSVVIVTRVWLKRGR
jgi:hypothetical protein